MKSYGTIIVLVVLAWTPSLTAQDCCDRCGCQSCRKVCRVVCDVKKVPHTTYTCECEDFCVPKRSQRDGCTCEVDCHGCEKCKPNYVPTCASVRTKKKLIKHVEMKEEKTYKWVVEYLCDDCCHACAAAEEGMDDQTAPPAPPASAPAARKSERNVKPMSFLESIFGSK